ncbi:MULTISPECIES: 2-dehydropantoate 2-reductase [unclassified Pseudoalteromonas]|uniref:2-dehydropantoate 2-reductase n=1 Tax=unclassified Pseudoalteromonas TaxID=194690 RepID=UPI000CF6C0DB|nr:MULTISPECIES: 2-dehydropantoate 2-reductase [unclassified Pseudoalteromonas]
MRIAVFGAGSTGCYLGALLSAAQLDVSLICRARIKDAIIANGGIHISDYQGLDKTVMPDELITEPGEQLFDVVFVTLKCHQLPQALPQLLAITHKSSELVFMQNGLGSFEAIQDRLAERTCVFGITPFNVLQQGAHFHKGTEGEFVFAKTPGTEHIAKTLREHGFNCELKAQMTPVIYGKLLLNLNNALNAVADMPIKQELENKALRRVLAAAMKEWLAVCKAMNIELAQFTKVKPALVPRVLSLPNWLFRRLASAMLDIDPKARSSMWEDIQAGRKTEIAYLNGAVVALGQRHGVATPVNSAIVACIEKLERGGVVKLGDLLLARNTNSLK